MITNIQLKEWYEQNKDKAHDIVKVLGVEYAHVKLPNDDDLYVTSKGLPFLEQVKPENFWSDKQWFNDHSVKRRGS